MGYMGTGDTGTLDFVEHNQEMNDAVAKNLDLADEVAKIKASMFQWSKIVHQFSQQLYTSIRSNQHIHTHEHTLN